MWLGEELGKHNICTFWGCVNLIRRYTVLYPQGHGADRSMPSAPTGLWAPGQAPMGLSRDLWGQEKLLIATKFNSGVKSWLSAP